MGTNFYETAARADALVSAITRQMGLESLFWGEQQGIHHPVFGGQSPVDTQSCAQEMAQQTVSVCQYRERFRFRNHWGFE